MRRLLHTLPLSILLSTSALAQEPAAPPAGSMSRAADGAPVCGLGAEFHATRRAALRESLKEGVLVVRGLPPSRGNLTFRQDKNFWWLTGVESPNVAFAMDIESGHEVLFVYKPSAWKERWEGEIWDSDDAWVSELTGIEDVRPTADLLDVVEEMLGPETSGEAPRRLWTNLGAHIGLAGSYDSAGPYDRARAKDPLDGRVSREKAFAAHLEERFGREVHDCWKAMSQIRVVKTAEEIAAMERAARSGALAMCEAMRSCRPGLGEWDLDALLNWIQARHGADGPAYAAIVGSGANSLVLHYNFSARRMRDGEVVLIDFGPEVDHYTTDITRTFPVNGKFTDRQAEIYDVVLAAQAAGIAAARPGSTIADVELACRDVILEAGMQEFMRHGAVHSVGMEVHDPGSMRGELVPGMCFTIEPGLYEDATGIGVRIEDVVAITADGCRVISDQAPKERSEIEALMAEAGVLDWVDGRSDR